jgi:peptidyl-prolyl cis-trans isomerase A (cyclophilin A)
MARDRRRAESPRAHAPILSLEIPMSVRPASILSVLALLTSAAMAQPPGGKPEPASPSTTTPAPAQPAKPETPKAPPAEAPKAPAAPAEPAKPAPAEARLVYVKMSTTAGDIVLELNAEKAPVSVANFLAYADKKFYEGTIFHRVIPTFMIQGGGYDKDFKQKPTDPPIRNEWKNGLKNVRGSIAMARTAAPDSATSQFFINVRDNPMLDEPRGGAAYAVFGRVIAGMDVVDKIKDAETVVNEMGEKARPVNPVVINAVTRVTPEEASSAAGAGGSGGAR